MTEPPAHPPRRRHWTWLAAAAALCVVVAAPFVFSNRMQPLTAEVLRAARQRWEKSAVTDYDMQLRVSGAQHGLYQIEVRGGRLQDITVDGRPANPAQGEYWTVRGLFRTMDQEMHLCASDLGEPKDGGRVLLLARFDAALGHPTRFMRQVPGSSRGVQIEVERLEVRRTGPDQ